MSGKLMEKIGQAVVLAAKNISLDRTNNLRENMTTAIENLSADYAVIELHQKIKLVELKFNHLQQQANLAEQAFLRPQFIKALEIFIQEVKVNQSKNQDFPHWCLAQKKSLQLELLALRHSLQQELIAQEVKKSLELVTGQQKLQKSPMWLIVANLLKEHKNNKKNTLQVFLAFPSLSLECFNSSTKVSETLPQLEKSLAEAMGKFCHKYTNAGRKINFFSGVWVTKYLQVEANIQALFTILKTEPTLVLESEIDGEYLNFRLSFWDGYSANYLTETVLSRLGYKNILNNNAKSRALAWLKTRNQLIAAGEKAATVDRLYGGENLQNLMTLNREVKLKKRGINVKELAFNYLINQQDVKVLGEIITVSHCLLTGLVADKYFLCENNITPLFPRLIPELLAKLPDKAGKNELLNLVGLYYHELEQSLAATRQYILPELNLELAAQLAHWYNKNWAKKQLIKAIKSWLQQRQLSPQNTWKALLDATEAALREEDGAYLEKLNHCLAAVGETRRLKIQSRVKQELAETEVNLEQEIAELEQSEQTELEWVYEQETLRYSRESDERTIVMVADPEKTKPADFSKLDLQQYNSNLENFIIFRTLTEHSGTVRCLAITPDGEILVSGSYDKTIKIWQLATGEAIRTLKNHTGDIEALAISPNGKILASASDNNTIKLWELKTGRQIDSMKGNYHTLAISPDGKILATSDNQNYVNWWEMSKINEVQTCKGHSGTVYCIAFSPTGDILVSGSADQTIKLWDLNTGKEKMTLTGHTRKINCLIFSPDGKTLYSGSDDRSIKAWAVSTGAEICTFRDHVGWVYCLTISPDGKILFSGSADKTIKMWQVSTGAKIRTLKGHSNLVYTLAMSPNGQILVSGSADNTIKIWRRQQTSLSKIRDIPCLPDHPQKNSLI
ncbi:MAG: WD40 repeat domain-containing protein [Gomphosphaeria aponina SAG 52.96 = DSM 107014]|uniref:WD40 repeat domain-containing protein n=1 Tax=Gomphosphaeria aponina SAG 52.96 = DSM 107014 TaxID=1521640 RepID=A0A941JSV5_9CHRO|nr:WD40 repeat domain-containing protein [Gomphosphaeria aponina SAG 52.96 = DSM 107014]